MKLQDLFDLTTQTGISCDPRGKAGVKKHLARVKKRYENLPKDEQQWFDTEQLTNPYADSRIYVGTGDEEVKHLFIGIDIETPELILVDRLNAKGAKIDTVMVHHPEGRALWELDSVMDVQVDLLAELGVPEQKADAMLRPRRDEIYRRLHFKNWLRNVRAAELLNLPYFGVHNSADHCAADFVRKKVGKKQWDNLGQIMKMLEDIEEYAHYAKKGNPPIIAAGSASSRPGKVAIFGFQGGTNGPKEFLRELSDAGVGTILCMHIGDEERKLAQKHQLNIIQCSHMASDSLGINLVVDALQKKDRGLKVTAASGFVRVKR